MASASNLQQGSDTNNDNKKVHFNKFATVQMMEWWRLPSDMIDPPPDDINF